MVFCGSCGVSVTLCFLSRPRFYVNNPGRVTFKMIMIMKFVIDIESVLLCQGHQRIQSRETDLWADRRDMVGRKYAKKLTTEAKNPSTGWIFSQ
jgi:hypothetical protein